MNNMAANTIDATHVMEVINRIGRGGQLEMSVYVDNNIPHPLLDSEGNRVLCIEVTNPVDGSKSIIVHPDDYDDFVTEMMRFVYV